uniref:Putative secreted protein n=1 Tax=Anopheles triannulatus TaxID=58253 RepID=A0A2M4B5W2_9DIPT
MLCEGLSVLQVVVMGLAGASGGSKLPDSKISPLLADARAVIGEALAEAAAELPLADALFRASLVASFTS